MKKILLLIIAVYASAGIIVGGNLKYSKVNSDVQINNTFGTYGSTNMAYNVKAGYAFKNFRLLGYAQFDQYSKDIVLKDEGDSISYGIAVEYKYNVKDNHNVILGLKRGAGKKDLGTSGNTIGIAKVGFVDTGIKAGYIYTIDNIELEASAEYVARDFDRVVYSGYDVRLNEQFIGLILGVNYNF